VIVIDACVLSDALIDDGPVGIAARRELTADPHWAAPAHLFVEVVSVIRGRALARKLDQPRAQDAIEALPTLVVDNVEIAGLVERIWQLRGNLTAYDAAYVAAAESLDCALVTSDVRLAKAPAMRCEIRLVAPR
jgi:predicted nucleic acid-binding protein